MIPCARPARAFSRLAALVLIAVLLPPLTPAWGVAAPRAETPTEAAERERGALADLENSTAEVRAAAVQLRTVAVELPGAQADVARARGELVGARAKVAAAESAVDRAEQARAAAVARVERANGKVVEGREDVAQLVRRTYQRGRLAGLREVMDAGDPQQVLERASMLRSVFRYQDASLKRLTRDRLSLARTESSLEAEERAVTRARGRAQEGEQRARAVAVEAETAADRVASLVDRRAAALASAETHRAADQREYQQAQAASRALAERIRAAARRAAEAERRRVAAEAAAEAAAEKAADEAERKRRQTARQPAPPPRRRTTTTKTTSPSRSAHMEWPCYGCRMTSRYGYRTHPIFGDRRFHAGIDMGAPIGTTVHAADGGTVTYAGYASGYGTLVVISHGIVDGRDLSTAYAHMDSMSVSEGQRVGRGTKVGEVGNEGNSTGPHLHFEVRRNGDPVDPLGYVDPP